MSDSKSPSVVRLSEPLPEARFEWNQSPFEAFLERNFKFLLAVVIGAAVVGAGWLIWRQQREKNRLIQAQAFTSAETLDDYKKVAANFSGSEAAGSAHYMIANLLAQNNDQAGALEEWRKFNTEYPHHPLHEHAAFRVALLTLATGDVKGGVEQLETFLAQYPQSPLRGLAQLRQADALVTLGEKDRAIEIYTKMTEGGALASSATKAARDEALERLEQVKLKPPVEIEFVPEPAAPTPGAPGTLPAMELQVPGLDLDTPEPGAETPAVESPDTPEPAAETPASTKE